MIPRVRGVAGFAIQILDQLEHIGQFPLGAE
jgi:hypothetical protein